MDLREHVQMLVAYVGVAPVAEAAGVPVIQVTRATHSGRATPHAQMALSRLELSDLDQALTFNSKGAMLRLRALYAMGYTTPMLASMMNTGHRQVAQILVGQRDWVRAAAHNRAKHLFEGVQNAPEPEGVWADNARLRARRKVWLRPIELEEDLIDVPEPWAHQALADRARQMSYTEKNRAHKSVKQGERSELVVMAAVEYRIEYNQRRKSREVAAHGSC